MKAGYIGLGHIGRAMARELVKIRPGTIVYDVMPEGPEELSKLGARVATSPAEVAEKSEIIGICVRTDQEVLEVVDGLLTSAEPGLLILIHSTVRPSTIHAAAEKAKAKGVRVVDAPVSRGSMEPEGKIIVYMLGGDPNDMSEAKAFVEPSAKAVIQAGALGTAMALKISNNLVTYTELMAAHEAFNLAKRSGVDPNLLLEVMTQNGNATPSMQAVMTRWATEDGPPSEAAIAHAKQFVAIGKKDLDCALEVGREIGLDLPGTAVARERVDIVMSSDAAQ